MEKKEEKEKRKKEKKRRREKKIIKANEQSVTQLRDNIKQPNVSVIRVMAGSVKGYMKILWPKIINS